MLFLTRKPGEKILVGDDVVIMVGSVNGRYVKIGIDAPESVKIFREEIAPTGGTENEGDADQ